MMRVGQLAPSGALLALLPLALPSPAVGQDAGLSADEVRAVLIHGLEQHRAMDVEFVRAIPDSALRWAPTPGVRDFAEQVEHIVLDNVMFVARAVRGEAPPSFGEQEAYLGDKDELVRVVNETYDYVIGSLRELPEDELTAETELFGRQLAKWRVYLLALAHADWTRGQLVPYFRLNGIDPPDWRSY